MRAIKIIYLLIITTLLLSCERFSFSGFFTSPSATVENRFTESMAINERNSSDTVINIEQETYTIYISSDIHISTSANNLSQFINIAKADNNTAFSIILGDITDQKDGMDIANDTISQYTNDNFILKTVVGNHDLYFNQWETYKKYFGSGTYHFIVQTPSAKDLYIVLDSGNGTLGNKQLEWLENLLSSSRKNYRHCIVFTHTNLWAENLSQFPSGLFSIEESTKISNILSENKVNFYFNGHVHHRHTTTFNDIEYVTLDAMLDNSNTASYVKVDIDNTINYDFHKL